MGDGISRHALLSPHKWARATSTGTGLPLPASAKAFGRLVALWPKLPSSRGLPEGDLQWPRRPPSQS